MGQTILCGNPPIEVTMRRSTRARRLVLRVSRLDGRVTLSVPVHVTERKAAEFANSRDAWLRSALADVPAAAAVGIGARIPFEGRELTIAAGTRMRSVLTDDLLEVPPARASSAVAAFLKTTARDRLADASDRHAATLGVRYCALALRDTRSRWGSCSTDRRLMYSWRLVMAPPEVLDYVAAHEVAHLERMDHSPAFWSIVAGLCPDYAHHRRWLRRHGSDLHRFVFGN